MPNNDLNPTFSLAVADQLIGSNVQQFVTEVSVEYAEEIAHKVEIKLSDARFPGGGQLALIPTKTFAWGNKVDVKFGFGPNLTKMGRFIIAKVRAKFPEDGAPGLVVTAYSADFLMMSNGPDGAKRGKALGTLTQGVHVGSKKAPSLTIAHNGNDLSFAPKGASTQPKQQQHQRVFKEVLYEDVVAQVAATYGFNAEIDPIGLPPQTFRQKASITDFMLIRGIANIVGFLFWVDGDESGYTLHFRDPKTIYDPALAAAGAEPVQEVKYTFNYGPAQGNLSTLGFVNADQSGSLISFDPEGSIVQEQTKLRVVFTDPQTGKIVEQEMDENALAPDPDYQGDPTEQLKPPESGAAIRIFYGNFSIETVADRRFKSAAEVVKWTTKWFQRNRENFQQGRGKIVGIEDLRAYQIHSLQGIGPWSGDWYFAVVKHVMDVENNGYFIDFHARKVVRP